MEWSVQRGRGRGEGGVECGVWSVECGGGGEGEGGKGGFSLVGCQGLGGRRWRLGVAVWGVCQVAKVGVGH